MTDQAQPTPQWINDKDEGVQFGGGVQLDPDDRETVATLEGVCRIGWAAHTAWEWYIGEIANPEWIYLDPEKQREVADSVLWLKDHPTSSVAAQHDAWRAIKAAKGWQFGEDKDARAKTHPNMVPFDELPFSQQMKAKLWRHITFSILG